MAAMFDDNILNYLIMSYYYSAPSSKKWGRTQNATATLQNRYGGLSRYVAVQVIRFHYFEQSGEDERELARDIIT